MGRIKRAIARKKRATETLLSILPESSPARLQLLARISRLDDLLANHN